MAFFIMMRKQIRIPGRVLVLAVIQRAERIRGGADVAFPVLQLLEGLHLLHPVDGEDVPYPTGQDVLVTQGRARQRGQQALKSPEPLGGHSVHHPFEEAVAVAVKTNLARSLFGGHLEQRKARPDGVLVGGLWTWRVE